MICITLELLAAGKKIRFIAATYNVAGRVKFGNDKSRKFFETFIEENVPKDTLKTWPDDWKELNNPSLVFDVINSMFNAQAMINRRNQLVDSTKEGNKVPEFRFTFVITEADAMFPNGPMASLGADRIPIVNMRNWAQELETMPYRSNIILISRYVSDIHDSIRGLPHVNVVSIPKPNHEDRATFLNNWVNDYKENRKDVSKEQLARLPEIRFEEGFDIRQFAIQSAGMSRMQIAMAISKQVKQGKPIGAAEIRILKQTAIEEEYEGIVDFEEPTYGFERVGGHENLKDYFVQRVINPLKEGDLKRVSSGVLLLGPPGTSKTVMAKALAKESGLNFMLGNVSRLFGGIVGESETRTRKFIEAVESAAPVILVLDEMDTVLASGRSGGGDSGTSARLFNSLMQFLSEDTRKGRVFVIGISNRPDKLDGALIRRGRFDEKLAALPPGPNDSVGRYKILIALLNKHGVKLHRELDSTKNDKTTGLGKLLLDSSQTWTGAEIEVVVKDAYNKAYFANRLKSDDTKDVRITIDDWNRSLEDIIPSTGEVEKMTCLALYYTDHLGYVAPDWKAIARDKKALAARLLDEWGIDVGRI